MKMVSIVIPVYNVSPYLSKCIESVLAQTYSQFEIILINDGSTDNSGEICDQYAQKDERVRVIHQENGGAANAKNTGLDNATGVYIAFIDSDDYVEPLWLARAIAALEENNADIVEYDFTKEFISGSEAGNPDDFVPAEFTAETYLAQYLNNWTCSLFWNKIFKSDLIAGIRFRKERRCIDDEFFTYKVISNAQKIVRITDSLYHYRQRRSSAVSSEKNKLQISDDAVEVLIERYEWITRRFPDLRKVYLQHDVSIQWHFANSFRFSETSFKKLKKTSRFYLCQCMLYYPKPYLLRLALRILMISKRTLMRPTSASNCETLLDNYYI